MLRVSGLLPTGCKMLDTPGVPHAHQVGGRRGSIHCAGCAVECEHWQLRLIHTTRRYCLPSCKCLQLSSQLTADEMRMVLPKRPLKPRTYRIGEGQVRADHAEPRC